MNNDSYLNGVLQKRTTVVIDSAAWTVTTTTYDGAGNVTDGPIVRPMTPAEIRAYKVEQAKQRVATDPNPTVADYAIAAGLREPE